MREASKKQIIKLMKEVQYEPFPGSLKVNVRDQLPEHAFEAIADHLVKNSITSLPHIMLVEYTRQIGPYEIDEVAIFNANHISAETAEKCFAAEEYNRDVLTMTKAQWLSIFQNKDLSDPAQEAAPAEPKAIPCKAADPEEEADTYSLYWRNAFVRWVNWESRWICYSIGESQFIRSFGNVDYSATDDVQAIKMILDRLVVRMYRDDLEEEGTADVSLQEYVSDLLANPYEWGTCL